MHPAASCLLIFCSNLEDLFQIDLLHCIQPRQSQQQLSLRALHGDGVADPQERGAAEQLAVPCEQILYRLLRVRGEILERLGHARDALVRLRSAASAWLRLACTA